MNRKQKQKGYECSQYRTYGKARCKCHEIKETDMIIHLKEFLKFTRQKYMDEITKIETIDQYDQLFGLETLHPLVNVVEFAKSTRTVEYIRMNIGFYCLFLKEANCGDLRYGRKYYDYQEGTVVCMAPGQVTGVDKRNTTTPRTNSIGILFHPDLIRGTSLGQTIKNYTFSLMR